MKQRRERKKSAMRSREELMAELANVEPGSAEEAELLAAIQERDNADSLREQMALMAVSVETLGVVGREKGIVVVNVETLGGREKRGKGLVTVNVETLGGEKGGRES